MRRQTNASKEAQKAKWFSQFNDALVAQRPELNGKVDWETADYLRRTGDAPEVAANKMAKIHE